MAYQTMRLVAATPVPEGSDERPLVMAMFMAPHGERRVSDKEINKFRFDAEVAISERAYAEPEEEDEEQDQGELVELDSYGW